MRIIAGNLKGKKIIIPNDNFTRPLKDLTKESIFNIIEHSNLLNINLDNSKVLDLFSGVGSFGLECISRGAESVTFFENYSEVLKILKKNIVNLNLEKQTDIFEKNIFKNNSLDFLNEKFDIIFLDPPYKEKKINLLIKKIDEFDLLKKKGIVIIHRHKNEKDIFTNKFKILIEKKYGISKIIFGKIV